MTLPRLSPDEHFRWCVYCGTDCCVDDPEHADDCPSVTRLFPINVRDLTDGMRCGDCESSFQAGDCYTHRLIEAGPVPIYEVVCTGCAALDPEIETGASP